MQVIEWQAKMRESEREEGERETFRTDDYSLNPYWTKLES